MKKIRVISNPYEEDIRFEYYDEKTESYSNIQSSEYSGDLISIDFKKGFFPFKAKQILDLIVEDFGLPNEDFEIEFQGTNDEFKELNAIYKGNDYKNIILTRSHLYLENARDILPNVVNIFQKIYPLIDQTIVDKGQIKDELEKFSEASGNEIPIYILGNFSSGKSTFINALIGYEFLPSSAKPTTAKIYKIKQSDYDDRAKITFSINGQNITLLLTDTGYQFLEKLSDDTLVEELEKLVVVNQELSIRSLLIKILKKINEEANIRKDKSISDLIQVELPFSNNSLLGRNGNRFVIFDTPGSDSANNIDHLRVLKNALKGLSNGLPIVVSEYESLDRTNADALADEINGLKELDNRFTMIVVNKADSVRLSDYSEPEILDFAVPKKLYASGIYFVSSLIGLGSKNQEEFVDDFNAEIFMDQKQKYIDNESNFYKQLYKYNIMPSQIKERYNRDSEENSNLLLVNSGLEEIEHAINDFAKIYSAYNKCQQSKLFLNKMIDMTSAEIQQRKDERERYRKTTLQSLETEKQNLISNIDIESQELEKSQIRDYTLYIQKIIDKTHNPMVIGELKEMDDTLRKIERRTKNIDDFQHQKNESWNQFGQHLLSNLNDLGKDFQIKNVSHKLAKTFDASVDDFKNIIQKNKDFMAAENLAENQASNQLIKTVREKFLKEVNLAQEEIESNSRYYWKNQAKKFKRQLSEMVTESNELSIEERQEIKEIIIRYQELVFEDRTTDIFYKDKFLVKFLGGRQKLNLDKLLTQYNKELENEISDMSSHFKESHKKSYREWTANLTNAVKDNIVEFSPHLHEKSEIIKDYTQQIEVLENQMAQIEQFSSEIQNVLSWKFMN